MTEYCRARSGKKEVGNVEASIEASKRKMLSEQDAFGFSVSGLE